VYSYLHKPGDKRGEIYRQTIQGKLWCVSFITVGEVLYGAYKDKWGAARVDQLRASLKSFVIVPYDMAVCQTYADLKSRMEASGKTLSDATSG
jgi:predicted nucleic acid-binding protein